MPDALAIGDAFDDGVSGCSYRDVADEAAVVSAWISELVPGAGRVLLMQEFSRSFIAAVFGALACGRTAAPVTTRARSGELGHLIDSVRPELIIADEKHRPVIEEALALSSGGGCTQAYIAGTAPWSGRVAGDPLEPADVDDLDIALILHTSGTTGRPKPVRLTHGAMTEALLRGVTPADGIPRGATLLSVPNNHVAGIVGMFVSVFSGRRLELLSPFTAAAWLRVVATTGVNHAFVVPTMLQRILREPGFDATDLSGLETVAYGGAPMPTPVLVEALRRFPPACTFVGSYGQTETGGTVCVLGPDDHRAALAGDPAAVARLRSIGRPLPGIRMAVVDESGSAVADGTIGELGVEIDETGWRRTGDLGYRDEAGYYFLTSRADDLIIRGGENIDPSDVELAIMTHPDVLEVAVVGLPDEEWGQIVAAYVVARPNRQIDGAALITHAKTLIASHKAPSQVFSVSDLPRTELGKIRRKDLAAHHAASRPRAASLQPDGADP